MKKYFNNKGRIILGALLLALSLLLALYLILPDKASSGVYLNSFHGNTTDGVNRTPASITVGHCQHCHNPHAGPTSGVTGGPYDYNLYRSRTNNAICFTAEAGSGCHAAIPTNYPAQETDRMPSTALYPYYFEKNSLGTRTPGVLNRVRWPGSVAYSDNTFTAGNKDYSPHFRDTSMPNNASAQGLCANCHNNPHKKGTNPYDMLRNTYIGPGPAANFSLCFSVPADGTGYPAATCHASGGVPSILANTYIEGLYSTTTNNDAQAGHQINCSSKSVSNVAACQTAFPDYALNTAHKMPCYNCHNPHGSTGGGTPANKNAYLINDDDPDTAGDRWNGIIDPIATAAQNRNFCLGCHLASDDARAAGSVTVMGIGMNKIPVVASAHEVAATTVNCYSCHGSSYTAATSRNVHHPDSGGSCIGCHSSAKGTRSIITGASGEFGLAWGHKASGKTPARGAVTDADCIVCHLEGNFGTQAMSAFHSGVPNGNIDLRNPDGVGEVAITDNSGAAFAFTKFALDLTAARGSVITNSVADVITQKFCLACHDSTGATNTTARTVGGTAFMPWGGVNLGANYTVVNGAASAGGLIDAKTEFLTTNSSKHPVSGPLNRDYATAARLNVPYKPTGTRGTSETLSQGVVMNCFDCHNTPTTALTTRTVAAHGNANTIRGTATVSGTPSSTNYPTLCRICHAGYDTNAANNHGAGSAVTNVLHNSMQIYLRYGCNVCHSSGYGTAVVRPVRAQDVHGFNVLPTTGIAKTLRWSGAATGTPATVNARPYCFIRNTQNLGTHNPKKISATTYTPQCYMGSVAPCAQGSTNNYTVGGTY